MSDTDNEIYNYEETSSSSSLSTMSESPKFNNENEKISFNILKDDSNFEKQSYVVAQSDSFSSIISDTSFCSSSDNEDPFKCDSYVF